MSWFSLFKIGLTVAVTIPITCALTIILIGMAYTVSDFLDRSMVNAYKQKRCKREG